IDRRELRSFGFERRNSFSKPRLEQQRFRVRQEKQSHRQRARNYRPFHRRRPRETRPTAVLLRLKTQQRSPVLLHGFFQSQRRRRMPFAHRNLQRLANNSRAQPPREQRRDQVAAPAGDKNLFPGPIALKKSSQ